MNIKLFKLEKNLTIYSKFKNTLSRSQSFSLSIAAIYIFFIALALALFTLNNLTNRSSGSYRISLQSRFNFGTEPSSLTIIVGLIIALVLFLIFSHFLKNDSFFKYTKIFSNLLLPSGILFVITTSQFFFGKIDLRNSGFSVVGAFQQVWLGNFWTRIASYGITVFSVLLCFLIIRKQNKFNLSNSMVTTFLPWWIPLIVDLSFLITSKFTFSFVNRFLFWLTLSTLGLFLASNAFEHFKKISKRFMIALFVFTLTFIALYLRRPTQVLTWRPNLILENLAVDRFFIFAGIIALLVSISILAEKQLFLKVQLITGGLWALFSVPFTTFNIASMDNFHYGEFVGSWFDTNALRLIPYRDIEYPRGLLTNYIPASFGNFLSSGFPEAFNYWFVFLSFSLGIYFTFVMKNILPLPLVFTLLMILPKANGYFEIDILVLLTLMNLIAGLLNPNYRKITTYLLPPICILWILLTPGQGIILLCLAIIAFIYIYLSNLNEFNAFLFSRKSLVPLFVTLCFLALSFRALVPAVTWVIRNSSINNQLFGDGWLNQALAAADFPISLRFMVLVLAPILFLFILLKFSRFDSMGRILSIITISYLVLISGRWFGRVDENTMSRIGAGFLIALIILALPLFFILYQGKFVLNSVQTPALALIFALSISWNPFNINYFVPSQPVTIVQDANYSLMLERGKTYRQISNLSQSLFGSNVRMLNLTGGNALDQYLRIPSLGGVHSPYVVTNDSQESDWLNRIKMGNPNFILGGYGSVGSAAFDGSGLGGRAPQVLSWVISNYQVADCGDFIVAVSKKELALFRTRLDAGGCKIPQNENDNLSLWNRFDSTPLDLGSSLLSWPTLTNEAPGVVDGHGQSIQISLQMLTDPVGFRLKCSVRENAQFSIKSNSEQDSLIFTFTAVVESGQFAFKPSIFPISSLLNGNFDLTLHNSRCQFI